MAKGGGAMTKKTAIITGAAGGLGRALDQGLHERGWQTVAIDLSGAALDAVASGPDRHVHACDLTDSGAVRCLCEELRKTLPSVDLVIYNAGVTQIGDFADLTEQTHRKVLDINYFAAVNMAQALLEDVRKSRGTHLAISSVAGFSPLLRRTAYAASKHALEGFFKSLRAEEKAHGVRCVIAAPSFVATNIGASERQPDGIARPGSAPDGIDYMLPRDAANEILNGLDRGRNFIPVGRIARLAYLINRLSPALFERLMARQIR